MPTLVTTQLVPVMTEYGYTFCVYPSLYYTYYAGEWILKQDTPQARDLTEIHSLVAIASTTSPYDLPIGKVSSQTPYVRQIISQEGDVPTEIRNFNIVKGGRNSPFLKRRNDGEILFHPYYRANIKYTREPVVSSMKTVTKYHSKIMSHTDYILDRVPKTRFIDPAGKEMVSFNDSLPRGLASAFQMSYDLVEVKYSDSYQHQFDYDRNFAFLSSKAEHQEPDPRLVTKLLGQANEGYFDLLTFYAELPKTIEYLWACLKRLYESILFFRQKEISLGMRKKRPPLIPYGASGWIERDRIKENKRRKREWKKSVDLYGIPDAVAQVRLEFMYAIKPIISDIQGISKAIEKIGRKYQTSRTQGPVEVTGHWGNWSFEGSISLQSNYWLKRSLMINSFTNAILDVTKTSVLTTGIELIKIWGIVIDYTTNIGDFLSAWQFPEAVQDQKSSVSFHLLIHGKYTHVLNPKDVVNVSGYIYDLRKLSNPLACTAILPADSMSLSRVLNLIALSWVTMRGKIRNSPSATYTD